MASDVFAPCGIIKFSALFAPSVIKTRVLWVGPELGFVKAQIGLSVMPVIGLIVDDAIRGKLVWEWPIIYNNLFSIYIYSLIYNL